MSQIKVLVGISVLLVKKSIVERMLVGRKLVKLVSEYAHLSRIADSGFFLDF